MVTTEKKPFAVRLKRLREEAKMSQQELASRSGLSVSIVAQLEQGAKSNPRLDTLLALAHGLSIAPEKLIA